MDKERQFDFIAGSRAIRLRPSQPPRFIWLVPSRLRREIAIFAPGRYDGDEAEVKLLGVVDEAELRALATTCRRVADWLHEHTV